MRILLLLLSFCLLFRVQHPPAPAKGCIHIEYLGAADKPYYDLYFYLPGSLKNLSGHGLTEMIEVNRAQYDSIKGFINAAMNNQSPCLPYDMGFQYVEDRGKKLLTTKSKPAVYAVCRHLHYLFANTKHQRDLDVALESLLYRLGIDRDIPRNGW